MNLTNSPGEIRRPASRHWGLDKGKLVPSILPLFQLSDRFLKSNQTHKMALKIRLSRVGTKNEPHYRVVVADSRSPRDGRFIEIIGRYNPQTNPSTIELDETKVQEWLAKGAQPSDPVAKLIKIAGIGASGASTA